MVLYKINIEAALMNWCVFFEFVILRLFNNFYVPLPFAQACSYTCQGSFAWGSFFEKKDFRSNS